MNKKGVIGISIGGTKTAVCHSFYDGQFEDITKIIFPTKPNDPIQELDSIDKCIKQINKPFDMISIICGGPLNVKTGVVLKPPHLPGFDNFPIVQYLKDKYQKEVCFLNDADACALAEYIFGAGRGFNNVAYLTFGTGLGAGLIINGQLYLGATGMAGEIGHIRLSDDGPIGYGKAGSVEGFCAGGNIPVWAKEYVKGKDSSLHQYKKLTTKDIAVEANKGDKAANEIFDIVATRLGQVVSLLIDSLNLDCVILGGIYPRAQNLLEKKMMESIKKESVTQNFEQCAVVPSKLKEEIDDYSSLVGVLQGKTTESLYGHYPELNSQRINIESAITALEKCYKNNGKILVCGNGGSASDSAHMVAELMKGFISKRPLDSELLEKVSTQFDKEKEAEKFQIGVACIDLTAQTSLNTAFANDVDSELVYAQQILGYSRNCPHDVVVGISTSGNSKNVVNALKAAKALGLESIALTGEKESELSKLASICIKAPSMETYRIQEYHLPIYQYICMELEKRL